MVRYFPPLFIIPATFLLCSVPVHGRALDSREITGGGHGIKFFLRSWYGIAFVIALIATIFLGYLFIVSIQSFFRHLNKDPTHLFSQQPVGEASTGQLFCTLLVLSLFLLTAYFPLFMAFIIIPRHKGEARPGATSSSLTYMAIDLGYALAAGALLALVSHRRYLHFGREEGTSLWKKVLDLAIIGFVITFITIRTPLAALPSTFEPQSKTALNVVWAMDHLRLAFYSLATIDIFVSAAFLWQRLKAAGIYDQVFKFLLYRKRSLTSMGGYLGNFQSVFQGLGLLHSPCNFQYH